MAASSENPRPEYAAPTELNLGSIEIYNDAALGGARAFT
jgi:hypothetical protein